MVNDELIKCMTNIMNEYGAGQGLASKRKVILRYGCPASMVNPEADSNAPPAVPHSAPTTKSAKDESCTKTADCESGLRCIKLTCVPPIEPSSPPASKPTSFLQPGLPTLAHGGGLNKCGCHFKRKTGECHCHRPRACGCACEPDYCKK